MAYQGYRHKSDKTVGANEATEPVKSGGENRTPAPTKRASVGTGYAKNGDGNASSILPGESVTAGMSAQAPVDAVLDNVIRGAKGGDGWQTRELSGDTVPTHNAMHANTGSPSGTVPSKCGGSPFNDEMQRRAAASKGQR